MSSGNGHHAPNWLDSYIDYAEAKSPMTPRPFHEGIGLWQISTVIARRLVLHMSHADVFPNLWVMLIGRSTLPAKTTAMNLGRATLRNAVSHLLLPDTSTPEALLETLSGRNLEGAAKDQAGQKGLIVDEASGMLAQAGRDYMAGAVELFLRLYDCPNEYERVTRGQGRVKVNGAYLTMLAASTPAMLAPYLKAGRMWSNGWWPRFALIPQPETRPAFRQSQMVSDIVERGLIDALEGLHRRLPQVTYPNTPEALGVEITSESMEAFQAFDKTMRYDLQTEDLPESLAAAYGRTPANALKAAMCLAAMDWPAGVRVPCIEMRHWQRAEKILWQWAQGAERAITLAQAQSEDDRLERVNRAIPNNSAWIAVRELCRATHLRASEVMSAVSELHAAGEIEMQETTRSNRGTFEVRRLAELSQPA